jgi:hypothetical protein
MLGVLEGYSGVGEACLWLGALAMGEKYPRRLPGEAVSFRLLAGREDAVSLGRPRLRLAEPVATF